VIERMPNNAPTMLAEVTMNKALWTVQVLWGIFFSVTGFGKILCYDPALWYQALQQVPWFSAVPQDLFIFIGVCEFLGGVGLILPAVTGVKPKLTPFAAFGLTLVMILAAAFHIMRGEYNFVPINLVLGGVTAFIAYGRLFVRPIAPASISTLCAMKGLAVLGALVLVDFAPVWYKLTHTH
jgi:DoxX-like family